jgi:hypothetical protein
MSAPLITPAEVSSIAFVNALDPVLILPMFISSAETKYIVPLVTQVLITDIQANPGNYAILVNAFIKPYLAFCVKYMFYNQLLTETDTFPTSDAQRTSALQEVIAIMEVSRGLLSEYLNASIFPTPVVKEKTLTAGFLKSKGQLITTNSISDVTSTMVGASTGVPSDPDTFNFINFATGLLNKITWSTLVNLMKSAGDRIYASIDHLHDRMYAAIDHTHSEFENQLPFETDPSVSQYIDDRLMRVSVLDPIGENASALWNSIYCTHDGQNILAGVGGSNGGRLYYSQDGGESWVEHKPAGDYDQIWLNVFIDNTNMYLYATSASGHVYRCTDGINWTEITPFTPNNSVFNFITGSNQYYTLVTIAGALYGRLFLSYDKGDSWSEIRPAGDVDGVWNCGAVSENGQFLMVSNLLLGSGSQVFLSSDSGASWQDITSTVLYDPSNRIMSIAMSFSGQFIAFTSFDGAYVSKDYGQSFEKVLNLYCHDCSITRTENAYEFAAFSSQNAIHTLALSNFKHVYTHEISTAQQPIKIAGSWDHKTFYVANHNARILKVEFREFAVCETSPASGTFVSSDSKTVTVTNGIITSIT